MKLHDLQQGIDAVTFSAMGSGFDRVRTKSLESGLGFKFRVVISCGPTRMIKIIIYFDQLRAHKDDAPGRHGIRF